MISLGTALAIAAFIINPTDRGFVIKYVILPPAHFVSRPFHRHHYVKAPILKP